MTSKARILEAGSSAKWSYPFAERQGSIAEYGLTVSSLTNQGRPDGDGAPPKEVLRSIMPKGRKYKRKR